MDHLDRAPSDRVVLEADLAEVSIQSVDNHLRDIDEALRDAGLGQGEGKKELLIRAWETAAESAREDTLAKYLDYFGLEQHGLDGNSVRTDLVQAAVIRGPNPGHRSPAPAGERQHPLRPHEVRAARLGNPGRRLPGDRGSKGAPRHLPRREHPRSPGGASTTGPAPSGVGP